MSGLNASNGSRNVGAHWPPFYPRFRKCIGSSWGKGWCVSCCSERMPPFLLCLTTKEMPRAAILTPLSFSIHCTQTPPKATWHVMSCLRACSAMWAAACHVTEGQWAAVHSLVNPRPTHATQPRPPVSLGTQGSTGAVQWLLVSDSLGYGLSSLLGEAGGGVHAGGRWWVTSREVYEGKR